MVSATDIPLKQPDDSERPFRSLMTFGTGPGAPSASVVKAFKELSLPLVTHVPLELEREYMSMEHDMSEGSEHLLLIDGMVMQASAELWATERILNGQMALLTMFHHVRSLYEAHAIASWMFQDFKNRWKIVLKDTLRERRAFEDAAKSSIGPLDSDIAPAGHELLGDKSIGPIPSVKELGQHDPVLRFDYALFWKYASAHTHPAGTYTAAVDPASERTQVHQIIAGALRHGCAVYRLVATHYAIRNPVIIEPLTRAEEYARYKFPLA